MVVWERLLSQGQVWPVPLGSQFSSAGCCTCVRTSTACSALASTRDLVENRPRSGEGRGGGSSVRKALEGVEWFGVKSIYRMPDIIIIIIIRCKVLFPE